MAVWTFNINTNKDEIPPTVNEIRVKLKRVIAKAREAIIAALVETLDNIIEYARLDNGMITVILEKTADKIILTVKDRGVPFNPENHAIKGEREGLGILIATNMTDHYTYDYIDGTNISVFEKNY